MQTYINTETLPDSLLAQAVLKDGVGDPFHLHNRQNWLSNNLFCYVRRHITRGLMQQWNW